MYLCHVYVRCVYHAYLRCVYHEYHVYLRRAYRAYVEPQPASCSCSLLKVGARAEP